MHASLGIERANQTLSVVTATVTATDSKVDMAILFQELRSPEERELRKFIESKGGPDKFLKDDALMDELIARSEKNAPSSKSGKVQEASGKEIKYDLRKDISDIIQDNFKVSENLFHALRVNISVQMETTVRREGDRIIGTLLAGPGDRIIDPVSTSPRVNFQYLPLYRTCGRCGQRWYVHITNSNTSRYSSLPRAGKEAPKRAILSWLSESSTRSVLRTQRPQRVRTSWLSHPSTGATLLASPSLACPGVERQSAFVRRISGRLSTLTCCGFNRCWKPSTTTRPLGLLLLR